MGKILKEHKKRIDHWKVVMMFLMIYDCLAVAVSYFVALWIRFDCQFSLIEKKYLQAYYHTIVIYAFFCVIVFWSIRLYKSIWRFASYTELVRMIAATMITGLAYMMGMFFMVVRMPVSYYIFGILMQFFLTLGIRFSYRFVLLLRERTKDDLGITKRVMLIGAGRAGQMIFRDINSAIETNEKVYCFIDDNKNKWGRYIDNVPVFGGRDRIMEAVDKFEIEKIYVAMPSASPEDKRDILRICNETSCELMNLPGMYQLYTGEVTISKMKPVQIEDLLGKDPIEPNMTDVFSYIAGKVVLVTGVGSIGSELARQIATHNPKKLILFDIYENNALGTYKTAYAAMAHGCKRFVLISTDKAVNPTNIMGASKRLCEMIIQSFDAKIKEGRAHEIPQLFTHRVIHEVITSPQIVEALKTTKTEFVAVRFGNVLGSNGSVVPLFKKQIEAGGPVTVTHPDIIRYFMTIPEAVRLVLLAGTHANGGEIFVLDMGEPVKIDTLARNLIRLSGYKPDVDIKIEYTGLRDIIGTTKNNLCFSMV